jgi:hypothetical protein
VCNGYDGGRGDRGSSDLLDGIRPLEFGLSV